jgi:enterochelin esterase-like enzyme
MKRNGLILVLLMLMLGMNAVAHEIIKGTLKSKLYYPGTEREIQVYVPDAYDGKQPACLYVGLDGILCNAPNVMDSLIAVGKMPVTIGVFVQPGVIKDKDGNVVRYNRSNEFDMTTRTFVSFIEKEVLPWVENLTTARGLPIKLSHRGTDGMIFGLSSGGIAAFTAAWHRPELFSRVFSGVGTFVAMRGGNDLQAIVRKSEPRPLRIFLQDGTNDVWNPLFGHWYEGNRMLASALDFAGYDARYDWSDCYHGVKRANEIFPEVMEWMWQGWPEAPKCGKTQNNLLDTMLVYGGRGWKPWLWVVKENENDVPSAIYPDSTLIVKAHPGSNCLWQYTIDENGNEQNGQPFYWLHSYDNSQLDVKAMTFDGAGNLWVVTKDVGIQICDQNGRVRGILKFPGTLDGSDMMRIEIHKDGIDLYDRRGYIHTRQLHVTPPTPGVTPKSQGQG